MKKRVLKIVGSFVFITFLILIMTLLDAKAYIPIGGECQSTIWCSINYTHRTDYHGEDICCSKFVEGAQGKAKT